MNAPFKITNAGSISEGTPPKRPSPLQILVGIEGEALSAKDRLSLKHIAVNRSRSLLKIGHVIWVDRRARGVALEAISSQAEVDKTTPFAQWMTEQLSSRAENGTLNSDAIWQFKSQRNEDDFAYPFIQAYYAPFSPDPKAGGLLFTRDTAFQESEQILIKRLAQLFGMSAAALGRKKRARMSPKKRTLFLGTIAALALIALIPVPMTTLAPAEIVADTPYIITAPIDGVVEQILIPPNSEITKGTPLIRMVDTSYRNEFVLAGQERAVADAKLRQASLTAFIDDKAKREIAAAKAEKALAGARQDYARDRLSKTILSAPKAGLAIYSDPTDWAGRPVATGEAIIQIADPTRVLLRIDAPLAIGETLQSGARVRMFIDSDPLNPIEAELISASYYAQATPDGHMAYEGFARLSNTTLSQERTSHPTSRERGSSLPPSDLPRIGTRGVAKIYGGTAPLGFWLFRRPITLARQFSGL